MGMSEIPNPQYSEDERQSRPRRPAQAPSLQRSANDPDTEGPPQADGAQVFAIPCSGDGRPATVERRHALLNRTQIAFGLLAAVAVLFVFYAAKYQAHDTGQQPSRQAQQVQGTTPSSTPPQKPQHRLVANGTRHRPAAVACRPAPHPSTPSRVERHTRRYQPPLSQPAPYSGTNPTSVSAGSEERETPGGLFSP
jgi:hypothetical protein